MFFREIVDGVCLRSKHEHPTQQDLSDAREIATAQIAQRRIKKLQPLPDHTYPNDYIYDEETFPNFFCCAFTSTFTGERWLFEISEWVDDSIAFYDFLMTLVHHKIRLVGFNNVGFDYPILHMIIECRGIVSYQQIYSKAQHIIALGKQNLGHTIMIWENQRFIPQLDLFKIYHFDNKAKSTSLKIIEFNMRSDNIQELPYDFRLPLTLEQASVIRKYNHHDNDETEKLYFKSLPQIAFRESLSKKYKRDFMNHNDTKIGKDFFVMELEKAGIPAKNVRTKRESLIINDILLPIIKFESPEFNSILDFFRKSVIDQKDKNDNIELKGFFKGVNCVINGFQFDFGAGGLHASLHNCIIRESDTHELIDVDVASYYPNLAISNNFYPEHLTEKFCDIYLDVYNQRKSFKKGTPENAMLKLALNGVYGDSNMIHSKTFYDPLYTVKITINGQLLLCMLAEQLMKIPTLIMVQCNTDGITFKCPKQYVAHAKTIYKWWENLTGLVLEDVNYSLMAISHVNSYIAVYKDGGKVKRIGAYGYETALDNPATMEMQWHSDQSALIIPMAAEAALVHGTPIKKFILNHKNHMDFMLRTKVPKNSRLELRSDILMGGTFVCKQRTTIQNITRYYVSLTGGKLVKIMPYTKTQLEKYKVGDFYYHVDTGELDIRLEGKKPKSGKYKLHAVPLESPLRTPPPREIGINVGQLVTDCSNIKNFKPELIDYDFYIKETRKLVDPLVINEEI